MLALSLWFTPLTHERNLDVQAILLHVGEKKLIKREIQSAGWYAVQIPVELLHNFALRIRFEIPYATSLAEPVRAFDATKLGVQLEILVMKQYFLGK